MSHEHRWEWKLLRVIRVVDGDTVDLVISRGFGDESSMRFRLAHIDTPEIYGRNTSEAGRRARDFTVGWLTDRRCVVRTYKGSDATIGLGDGAFGRWLCTVIDVDTGEDLVVALTEAGFAG